MVEPVEQNYETNFLEDISVRIRDNEERQRMLKDRTLLIGKNMIEMREHMQHELIELKKSMQNVEEEIKRMKHAINNLIEKSEGAAKKSDFDILIKQARMFQPMELVTKSEPQEMLPKK